MSKVKVIILLLVVVGIYDPLRAPNEAQALKCATERFSDLTIKIMERKPK